MNAIYTIGLVYCFAIAGIYAAMAAWSFVSPLRFGPRVVTVCLDDDRELMTMGTGNKADLYRFDDWREVCAAFPFARVVNDSGDVLQRGAA